MINSTINSYFTTLNSYICEHSDTLTINKTSRKRVVIHKEFLTSWNTLYTVDVTEFVTAQIDATFHEGRGEIENVKFTLISFYRH